MPSLEICSIKPGPDGLTRITARRLGEGVLPIVAPPR